MSDPYYDQVHTLFLRIERIKRASDATGSLLGPVVDKYEEIVNDALRQLMDLAKTLCSCVGAPKC